MPIVHEFLLHHLQPAQGNATANHKWQRRPNYLDCLPRIFPMSV